MNLLTECEDYEIDDLFNSIDKNRLGKVNIDQIETAIGTNQQIENDIKNKIIETLAKRGLVQQLQSTPEFLQRGGQLREDTFREVLKQIYAKDLDIDYLLSFYQNKRTMEIVVS